MAKRYDRIEDVMREINRLENSEYVALAKKSEQVDFACRQYMMNLQRLEEKGIDLASEGITMARLEAMEEAIFSD